jgi:hypothetical protein
MADRDRAIAETARTLCDYFQFEDLEILTKPKENLALILTLKRN